MVGDSERLVWLILGALVAATLIYIVWAVAR